MEQFVQLQGYFAGQILEVRRILKRRNYRGVLSALPRLWMEEAVRCHGAALAYLGWVGQEI